MAKRVGAVDVRYNRTKREWIFRSFAPGVGAAGLILAVGYVLSSIGNGLDDVGFGANLDGLSLRPVVVVAVAVFAVISGASLPFLRPRLVSGGDGAGVGRPAGHARVWPGPAAADELGNDGALDGSAVRS